ncbi:hypothetical protein A3Q56_01486 [Intoshia linei]|uniref:Uncharacterized protein n=1 Tax=Intoshia linei TaxID=1819745 RepID=A0A177B979_9BILA|nr:hypothetical protein A3Q56_01486 [Intoshia linei]
MIVDKLSNQYFRNSHLFLQASILQSIKCISYQHFNMQLLSDGLYAMYLNSSFTIDGTYNIMINPLEPHHLPNVLIREIPLISNKEWSSLFDRNQQNIFKTFVYNLIMPFLKQYSINNCDEIYIYDKLIHLKKNVKVILLYKMSHSPTQSCEELNFINLTTFENYYAYMYYNSTFKMFCNTSYDYYFYEKVAKKSYSQELIKLKNDITTTWNQFQWIKRTLESINTKYSKRYKFELQDNI